MSPMGRDMAAMHKDRNASMAGQAGDPAKVSRTVPVEVNRAPRQRLGWQRFCPDHAAPNPT